MIVMWPILALSFLAFMRTDKAKAAAKPTPERKRKRKRRRKRERVRKARKRRRYRRKKAAPADKLPDPIKDLFGPKAKTKPKAKRRRRKRKPPPKPAPTRKTRRKRRRRRTPKPIPPTTPKTKPVSKPVAVSRRPTVAEQFVTDLRAGELNRDGVARAQRGMGGLDPDGIGGGKTMGRTEQLLKRSVDWSTITWPRTPSIPTPPSAKIAARELVDYVHTYKGSRRPRIRKYQRVMGMSSTPGRIGPATKRKVMELIGVKL